MPYNKALVPPNKFNKNADPAATPETPVQKSTNDEKTVENVPTEPQKVAVVEKAPKVASEKSPVEEQKENVKKVVEKQPVA